MKKRRKVVQKTLKFTEDAVEHRISHNHVHVRKSTFLAGLSQSVHRWFRLTPSYGPDLVRKMLVDMATEDHHVVLDPFSGAGTTVIESKIEGIASLGFEINPLLHFVCETCTRWDLSHAEVQDAFEQIERTYHQRRTDLAGSAVEEIGIPLPLIHNVFRWWRSDILKDLLILREAISQIPNKHVSAFFLLAFAGVLVPDLTNVTLGRLQLHFIDRSKDGMHVWPSYEAHAKRMIEDLVAIPLESRGVQARVLNIDSTTDDVLQVTEMVDRVITSPPYPNRYSYVWNTRPHLYMLGLFENAKQAAELDKKTIGGTWGTATSMHQKGVTPPAYPIIEKEVFPIADSIRKEDNLMANYLVCYFNKLATQIVSQNRILAPSARCAYVVGNSRLKGVYVETDLILAKVFEGLDLGFETQRIERIRKRHSGDNLHESIVYVVR